MEWLNKAKVALAKDQQWRVQAKEKLLPELESYDQAIAGTFGVRQQKRLTREQATDVATCLSAHRNVSLNF